MTDSAETKRRIIAQIDNPQQVLSLFVQTIQEMCGGFMAKVAIDGYAAVGKGTLARIISQAFGVEAISVGYFYRVLTWLYLRLEPDLDQSLSAEEKNQLLIKNLDIDIQPNFILVKHPLLPQSEVLQENDIRTAEINHTIPSIAEYTIFQDFIDQLQRQWMDNIDACILEGRQSYAVFAEEFKSGQVQLVYMTASQKELELREIRREASRLKRELTAAEEQAVVQELKDRNKADLSRENNPQLTLDQATEPGRYSFILDTTGLNEYQVALLFLLNLWEDNSELQQALFSTVIN